MCEISDEIVQSSIHWSDIACQLKECYADIVCETDYMEPISHISMKKNPLLSVRDLEKRIVSTTCQNFKVSEKGRKWLFGSRLFRKESDGSWASVWAFLFTDIIVLTSHTTRDRVFFVKEPPIFLEDVVTLHFNLPRKNENEFRLLFGPELPHQSRLDKLLPMKNRNKKPNQIILRTSNPQLKSVWKLLLQRQIITLNTRISKSSSSNFSISEFCEKFPDENHSSPVEERIHGEAVGMEKSKVAGLRSLISNSEPSYAGSNINSNNVTNISKCQAQCQDSNLSLTTNKPNQSNSDAPSKCFPITSHMTQSITKSASEWDSPLEIYKSGGRVVSPHSYKSNDSSACISNKGAEEFHNPKVSRASPADNTCSAIIEQVKVGNNEQETTFKSTTKATTNTELEIDHKPSTPLTLTRNQNQTTNATTIKIINENQVNLIVKTVPVPNATNIVQSLTTNQIKSNTSLKTSRIINNNNECISDFNTSQNHIPEFNAEDKCHCEVVKNASNELEILTYNESPIRKKVPLVEIAIKTVDTTETNVNSKRATNSPLTKVRTSVVASELQETRQGQLFKANTNQVSKGVNEIVYKQPNNSTTSIPIPQLNCSISVENERLAFPNSIVSQPGTKIKTNATLFMKNQNVQQRDVLPKGKPTSMEKETKESLSNTKEGVDSNKLSKVQLQPSSKPIHTDSPIISGFGSERSRRRILCDYKVRRDYPELFGITPKDRRTFIKSLAEKVIAEEKGLVAPYYYMTPSPLPIPKHIRNLQLQQQQQIQQHQLPVHVPLLQNQTPSVSNDQKITNSISLNELCKIQANILGGKEAEWHAHLQKFAEATSTNRSKNILHKKPSQEILEDLLEDESEGHVAGLNEFAQCQIQRRQRSPEESSSNDSGISEEMPSDKLILNKRVIRITKIELDNESDTIMTKCSSSRFNPSIPKTMSTPTTTTHPHHPSTTEVITSHFPSTITSSASEIDNAAVHASSAQLQSLKNNKPAVSFYEGDSKASVETMVAVALPTTTNTKVDKATATEDEDIEPIISEKPFSKRLMAQRREAFFLNGQSTSIESSSTIRRTITTTDETPFKVKIFPGNSVHQYHCFKQPVISSNSNMISGKLWSSCDRVQYTRLEKEKTARVERVESSDDSTSSDIASASPAPENENGTTDPSWSSSSSSLTGGYSCPKEGQTTLITAAAAAAAAMIPYTDLDNEIQSSRLSTAVKPIVPAYYHLTKGPEIVVTKDSPPEPRSSRNCDNNYSDVDDENVENESDNERDSNRSLIICNGHGSSSSVKSGGSSSLLRVESNDSTAENYGDDDEEYNFEEEDDDDEGDLSHCSLATINRYGTYESLEKIEAEDTVGGLPEFQSSTTTSTTTATTSLPRSKARFTFDDDDEDEDNVIEDENLFEEDFESDFNFRFPSQIQDNTYSVSRLGPLPPLLEEDFEDEMYDEHSSNSNNPGCSSDKMTSGCSALRSTRHEAGLRRDNSFLLTRIATMYARSSISPLKILKELWLRKRYREWAYKE